MKKKFIMFLFFMVVIFIPSNIFANQTFNIKIDNKNTRVNQVNVKVDGKTLNTEFSAYTINGRTFVPIRELTESLGANVSWDNRTKSATIKNMDSTVKMQIDSTVVYVNDNKNIISKDSVPKFAFYSNPKIETKTMVPLRFLSQTFGYKVDWDQKSQTALVTTLPEAAPIEEIEKIEKEKKEVAAPLTSNLVIVEPKASDGYRSQNEINQVEKLKDKEKAVEVQVKREISKTLKATGPVTIVIDAGHGGKDSGARSKDGTQEKTLALKVAKSLSKKLESNGYEVIMTRDKDEYIELLDRAGIANDENAELFLSIHFNSSANSEANGIETFYANEKTVGIKTVEQKHFASEIQKALFKITGENSRGVKDGSSYIVLNKTKTVAALTELGFMSNKDDLELITDDEYLEKLAVGLYNGINNYVDKYVEK